MLKLPINPIELLKSSQHLATQRFAPLHIEVLIDPFAVDAVIEEVLGLFSPCAQNGRVSVVVIDETYHAAVDPSIDALVLIEGHVGGGLASVIDALAQEVPVVLVSGSGRASELAELYSLSILDIVPSDRPLRDGRLAGWFAERLSDKRLACAECFPWMRSAIAHEYVLATSVQNAVVGGLLFIPGADLPVMTLNQAKMVLQIASTYGVALSYERLKELAAVVGGAFALRTVARELVGVVPVLGWAIKASIGYGGTFAMGRAAIKYFEHDGDEVGLADAVAAVKKRLAK